MTNTSITREPSLPFDPRFNRRAISDAWRVPAASVGALVWLLVAVRFADQGPARPWHSAMRPFGDLWMAAICGLAMLPLAGWLARIAPAIVWPAGRHAAGLASVAAPAWMALAMGGPLAVVSERFGAAGQAVLRAGWCLAFAWPWFWWIGRRTAGARPAAVWLVLAALTAWIVPHSYRDQWERGVAAEVSQLVSQHRLWDAWLACGRWNEVRSGARMEGMAADQLAADLGQELLELARRLETPLATDAPADERYERARHLMAVGRYDESRALAEPLAGSLPEAGLLLADLYAREGRWEQAAQACQRVRRQRDFAISRSADDRQYQAATRALAEHLRRAGRFSEACRVLEEAVQQARDARPIYLFELAEHHRLGGRPWTAARLYTQLADDPELGDRAAWALRELRRQTPACFLGGTRG